MYRNQSKIILQKCLNNIVLSKYDNVKSLRHLYSQAALGIDNYVRNRERVQSQFVNMLDTFRSKMSEFVGPDSKNMIFTEDLKNMIHLAEPNSTDVPLIVQMMLKFNSQNKEVRFGSFIFGPVVMRMFHYLDDPDSALQCFMDPQMEGFFDQIASFQILMDMLLEHERYSDLLKVYDVVKNQQIHGKRHPKNIIVLVCAACYKMNSSESLKFASELWTELMSVGHQPMRRAATFLAGLALNQNQPNVALEILSNIKQQNYITVRNIRALALAELGRVEESIAILRSVLNIDSPMDKRATFTRDSVEKIQAIVQSINNKEITAEFTNIEKYFQENGHYTEETLQHLLCSEIAAVQQNNDRNNSFVQQNFGRQNYFRDNQFKNKQFNRNSRRPGISDLQ